MARLLFVLDIGFDRAGPSVHLMQDILRSGLQEDNEVDVILKDTGGIYPVIPDEFKNNSKFHYYVVKETEEKTHGFIGRYINEILYAKKCSRIFLGNSKYDAAFLQSNTTPYFYMRYLKKLKCRIVFNVQDVFPYNLKLSGQLPMERLTFPILRRLQNMGYELADRIITISDDMKQTLIEDGVEVDKIKVIYNWSYADTPITLEEIEPDNIFDLHLDHNKFNVVYAGNIGKMQNVELIARAAYEMREDESVHFYIIGDGANKEKVKSIVDGLKNVTILPMQPSRYAESIYAQADLNVIPLMPGGIKTALPSKTATVLRVNKPVVFCIDKGSKIVKLFSEEDTIYFCDCVNEEKLVNKINELKNLSGRYIQRDISMFSTKNSGLYVKEMVGM